MTCHELGSDCPKDCPVAVMFWFVSAPRKSDTTANVNADGILTGKLYCRCEENSDSTLHGIECALFFS